MDLALFRFFNGLAGHSVLGDVVVVFFASHLQYVLGALLIAITLWPVRRVPLLIAGASSALIARFAVRPLVVLLVQRPRPFLMLTDVHNLIGVDGIEDLRAFPSGHAIFFFAMAMAVYRFDKRWGVVFFTGAMLMGVARIIGGVHWPSDIIVGALIGTLVGWYTVQWIPYFRKALPKRY